MKITTNRAPSAVRWSPAGLDVALDRVGNATDADASESVSPIRTGSIAAPQEQAVGAARLARSTEGTGTDALSPSDQRRWCWSPTGLAADVFCVPPSGEELVLPLKTRSHPPRFRPAKTSPATSVTVKPKSAGRIKTLAPRAAVAQRRREHRRPERLVIGVVADHRFPVFRSDAPRDGPGSPAAIPTWPSATLPHPCDAEHRRKSCST